MTIFNINPNYTGQIGILPRTVKVICNDIYSIVTAPGYINHNSLTSTNEYYPTDVFFVSYANNAFGIFQPTFSNNNITLVDWVNHGSVGLSGTLTGGNIVEALSSSVVQDGGVAVTALQLSANIKAGVLSYGGGGTSATFTINGLTTSSIVLCDIATSTNAVSILSAKITSANTLTLSFSGDPGASTTINYVAFVVAQ